MNTLARTIAARLPATLSTLIFIPPASLLIAAITLHVSIGLGAFLAVAMCAVAKEHADARVAAGLAVAPAPKPSWPAFCVVLAATCVLGALLVLFGATTIGGIDRLLVPAAALLGAYWILLTFTPDLLSHLKTFLRG